MVIGELTGIRTSNQHGRQGNAMVHNYWSHKHITDRLMWTAEEHGIKVRAVSEAYTSQTCPRCRSRHSERILRGFRCLDCGLEAHRDAVGVVDMAQGIILLPWGTYLELGLRKCELPRRLWSTGVSVTGEEFPLRAAQALVGLGERTMPVVAETYRDNSKRLVGRGFVDDYITTLDGPREELKISLADHPAAL
jgi:putative transposase